MAKTEKLKLEKTNLGEPIDVRNSYNYNLELIDKAMPMTKQIYTNLGICPVISKTSETIQDYIELYADINLNEYESFNIFIWTPDDGTLITPLSAIYSIKDPYKKDEDEDKYRLVGHLNTVKIDTTDRGTPKGQVSIKCLTDENKIYFRIYRPFKDDNVLKFGGSKTNPGTTMYIKIFCFDDSEHDSFTAVQPS